MLGSLIRIVGGVVFFYWFLLVGFDLYIMVDTGQVEAASGLRYCLRIAAAGHNPVWLGYFLWLAGVPTGLFLMAMNNQFIREMQHRFSIYRLPITRLKRPRSDSLH